MPLMEHILVIDCPYLGHRARFTTGPLSYKGKPTGVIYGFLNQLFTLIKRERPDEIAFAWDSRKSFRKEYYPDYKANRRKDGPPDPDMLAAFMQFKQLRAEILPQLGFVNNFRQTGCEADDIIGALVKNDPKRRFTIVTSDDDMLQLLDHCDMYNLGKELRIDNYAFTRQYGIAPEQWVMVKQIAGCSGDNVKGVTGVGEKTAIQYLTGKMNPSSKKYKDIQANQELIEFNEYLVRLPLPETKAPIPKPSHFDAFWMRKLCDDMGFNRMRHLVDDWEAFLG